MPKKPGANSRIVIDGYLSYSEIGEGEMSSTASAGRRTIEVLVRSTCVRIADDVLPWMGMVQTCGNGVRMVCVCFSCTAYQRYITAYNFCTHTTSSRSKRNDC